MYLIMKKVKYKNNIVKFIYQDSKNTSSSRSNTTVVICLIFFLSPPCPRGTERQFPRHSLGRGGGPEVPLTDFFFLSIFMGKLQQKQHFVK